MSHFLPVPPVLIVDDDRSTRFFLRTALESHGLRVVEAEHGERGVALYAQHRPGAAIVDYRMAGMDGVECCRRLRQAAGPDDLAIVMLTGREDPSLPAQATAAGADRFFNKPVHWFGLASTVRDLLTKGTGGPVAA